MVYEFDANLNHVCNYALMDLDAHRVKKLNKENLVTKELLQKENPEEILERENQHQMRLSGEIGICSAEKTKTASFCSVEKI